MFEYLTELERGMKRKGEGSHYLGGADQPFPQNPFFRSQPVLDEDARETIWRRVQRNNEPMKVVSADMGVDVRRVAAVVRLKEIEKRWVKQVSRFPLSVLNPCTQDSSTFHDDLQKKIRLVLKTILCIHGYKLVASLSEKKIPSTSFHMSSGHRKHR